MSEIRAEVVSLICWPADSRWSYHPTTDELHRCR